MSRSGFLGAYEKLHPQQAKQPEKKPEEVAALTLEDMKQYFEAQKESLLADLRAEMTRLSSPDNSGAADTSADDKSVTPQPDNNQEGGN